MKIIKFILRPGQSLRRRVAHALLVVGTITFVTDIAFFRTIDELWFQVLLSLFVAVSNGLVFGLLFHGIMDHGTVSEEKD